MYRWIAVFLMLFVLSPAVMSAQASGEEIKEETVDHVVIEDEQTADPAEGYIFQELYKKKKTGSRLISRLVGSSLTGTDRKLYDNLKQGITSVAAGEQTSTVFIVPLETIYPVLSFTSEDLGVEQLSVDGVVTPEAESAAREKIKSYHSAVIISALLADCPYELYWYNKSVSGGCVVTIGLRYILSEDGQAVTVNGYIKFSMSVAEEYAAGIYEVDPSFGQSVSMAAANAWKIVEQYKGYSDYERLLAYKNAICDLVSYNYDAAGGSDVPYGNPWQLVWVFDGNEDTNVVCEGYAKAFQYLNELSASSISVISPQGTVNGAAHMWNIVTMETGRKYLVDVTNCDSGMPGCPNELFLVGCISGNVDDGYQTAVGLHYVYNTNVFSESDLTLSRWNYLDAWPEVPVCTFSASKGFVGYQLAVRLNEDADEIALQENGKTYACAGRYALIPLEETGTQHFTIAAVRDGLMSDYGDTFTLEVKEMPEPVLRLPEGVLSIEEEAFRGVQAPAVQVPATVRQIGDYAFADNKILLLAETGNAVFSMNVFENCPDVMICVKDAEFGFQRGGEFLVMQERNKEDTGTVSD